MHFHCHVWVQCVLHSIFWFVTFELVLKRRIDINVPNPTIIVAGLHRTIRIWPNTLHIDKDSKSIMKSQIILNLPCMTILSYIRAIIQLTTSRHFLCFGVSAREFLTIWGRCTFSILSNLWLPAKLRSGLNKRYTDLCQRNIKKMSWTARRGLLSNVRDKSTCLRTSTFSLNKNTSFWFQGILEINLQAFKQKDFALSPLIF